MEIAALLRASKSMTAAGAAADGRLRFSRLEAENNKTRTRGERGPVTANHDRPARAARAGNMPTGHRPGTPRPMRTRVTTTDGRFPGSRVAAFDHLPRDRSVPSGFYGRRLAAYSCGGSCGIAHREIYVPAVMRTAFPWLALAGTTMEIVALGTADVNSSWLITMVAAQLSLTRVRNEHSRYSARGRQQR